MYKTILCAIEITNEAETVLIKASDMAQRYDARLIVIHILPYAMLPKDYQKELVEKVTPSFTEIADQFSIRQKDRMVKVGKPYELICHEAVKKEADLIMLGTHSKRGIKALIGSTANGVVNYAPCDVTLVRL